MTRPKKLLLTAMIGKMLVLQIGSYSAGMYILGITKNMWLSSVIWAIGSYIIWHVFESYMTEITSPEEWIRPIDRYNQRLKKSGET